MANDYNHFCFIGRLVRDCELRYTANGTAVAQFSIAVNKRIDKDREHVNYFDMILWGNFAIIMDKYLLKGQMVQVSGEVNQDRWKDKQSGNICSKVKFTVKRLQLIGNKNNYNQPQKQENVKDPWASDDPYASEQYNNDDLSY
jgi:single-strand DNA-binding protein